jgi:SGNH hydrolase-like domain, acetyltransferase AlgX
MRPAHIKVGLFALFLAAPIGALLLLGSVGDYGGPSPKFPPLDETLRGKKHRMDQAAEALLHRSTVTKLAVELRNWISYRLVGFADTALVVSGEGDWLFYRPEFQDGRCLERETMAASFRQLAVLIDIGRASGIDLFVSLSPDKSAIYPEMLRTSVRGYWKCRIESIAAQRSLIKEEAPALIDHAEALLAEKRLHPDRQLYFATDTHWTPYGGAIALRQLLGVIYPGAQMPAPHPSGTTTLDPTNLSRMLLVPVREEADDIVPLAAADWGPHGDPDSLRTVIVHDSFYAHIAVQLAGVFPNAVDATFDGSTGAGVDADRLIINTLESALPRRTREGPLAWDARLPAAIVQRNLKRAQECTSFAEVGRAGAIELGNGDSGVVPIQAIEGDRLPCLRLSIAAKHAAVIEVALPDATTGAFETGRSFKYRVEPGNRTIAFVLPIYVAGSAVRLQATEGNVEISAIETGDIAQPRLASAAP